MDATGEDHTETILRQLGKDKYHISSLNFRSSISHRYMKKSHVCTQAMNVEGVSSRGMKEVHKKEEARGL